MLRPFRKNDEFSLRKNISNRKIYRYTLTIPYPYTPEDAVDWVKKNLEEIKKRKPKKINFVIDINDEVVGSVGFSEIERHKAELGYWLGEQYWGEGLMTEAVKLATEFGFGTMKLRRIYARVFLSNKASMRVLEKNGYKLEGILRKDAKKDNKFIDEYLFAKVK